MGLYYVGMRLACDSAESSVSVGWRGTEQADRLNLLRDNAAAVAFVAVPAEDESVPDPRVTPEGVVDHGIAHGETAARGFARGVVVESVWDTAPSDSTEPEGRTGSEISSKPDLPGLSEGLMLRSPNGHRWLLTIDNRGLMQWVDLDKSEGE